MTGDGRTDADASDGPTNVAIACQGGGSHTAFAAGVLDRLLAEERLDFEVVGLSGTSGGAICAFATWFGLATEGRETARRLLAGVWDGLGADGPYDELLNAAGVGFARAHVTGAPLPNVSPYATPASGWGRLTLRRALESAVDPDALADVVGRRDGSVPRLEVGAVDVQRGSFVTFDERTVSHDAVLVSAAVPTLFEAAPVTAGDGTTRWYWDGLFSQNPPIHELLEVPARRKPDELWVVQINPQTYEG